MQKNRIPAGSRSKYEPSPKVAGTGATVPSDKAYERLVARRRRQFAANYVEWKTAMAQIQSNHPPPVEAWAALAEAMRALDAEHPVVGTNAKARAQRSKRAHAIKFAESGCFDTAMSQAIWGGLPKAQLRAIYSLLVD
jgi:hypothetical protein